MSCCQHHHEKKHACSCHHHHDEHPYSCTCNDHHNNHHQSCGCACNHSHAKGFLSNKAKISISLFALILSFLISRDLINWAGFPLSDPSWIAIILCGYPIAKSARNSLAFEGKITAPLLITIAMLSAIALQIIHLLNPEVSDSHSHSSYIFAAGEIAFLMALGEMLEEYTVKKSRSGIERLVSLSPQKALLKKGEETVEIEASQIKANDILVVLPYSEIPADGVILDGTSSIDQSNLTGESLPIEKQAGDEVLAGTMNLDGRIEIKALKNYSETAISKMIELVKEAEGKRAPIARIADKWASYIVPMAILFSILTGLFASFVLGKEPIEAITRGVTILVVFCPCALVLATPTAIAAGIGFAAKNGILIKSASALEELGKCKTFAFDKTGTLTLGKISVEKIIANSQVSTDEILRYALTAEASSKHPIASAIQSYAKENKLLPLHATNQKVLAGFGVECEIDGKKIYVGKPNQSELENPVLSEFSTLACVKIDDEILGYISFVDKPKPDALKAIQEISKTANCIMLTGDNEKSASLIAKLVGIKNFFANMLPADKQRVIEEAKKDGKICMVGDGVNDAPSLATADSSISMGALGSDIALENSDIIIMNDKLECIYQTFALSQRVISTIKANITVSMLVNMLAILLASFGILNPVTGAIWHNLASVLVVLNSTRLLYSKKNI